MRRTIRTAVISLGLGVVVLLALVIAQWGPHQQARALAGCGRNLNKLYIATFEYADDHGGRYPAADRWVDELLPYLDDPSVLRCPADRTTGRCSYAMNRRLSGVEMDQVGGPGHTVYLYEPAASGLNPSGDGKDQPARARHRYPQLVSVISVRRYLFADGQNSTTDSPTCPEPRW